MTLHSNLLFNDFYGGELPGLIESIGKPRFGSKVLDYLHVVCGVEHVAGFSLTPDRLLSVTTASLDAPSQEYGQNYQQMLMYSRGGLWRLDPSYKEAIRQLSHRSRAIVPTDFDRIRDNELYAMLYGPKNIKNRIVMCGKRNNAVVGFAMCWSEPKLPAAHFRRVKKSSDILFSILATHINATYTAQDISGVFDSLAEIETCICEQAPSISRRERQVCSRVIYGVGALGISLELGLSLDTVRTYRKRIYRRLGISSQHDLFRWYLGIWSHWSGRKRHDHRPC